MSETAFAQQILNTLQPLHTAFAPTSTSFNSSSTSSTTSHGQNAVPPPQPRAIFLPRMPKAYVPPSDTTGTGADASSATPSSSNQHLNVTLKPLKGQSIPLQGLLQPQSSIYDVKVQAGKKTGYTPDKVKVLWNKKPAGDSKTILEVIGGSESGRGAVDAIEFGVMFVGSPTFEPSSAEPISGKDAAEMRGAAAGPGASTKANDASASEPVSPEKGGGGEAVLKSEAFWLDLKNFVQSRIGDAELASKVVGGFAESYASSVTNTSRGK